MIANGARKGGLGVIALGVAFGAFVVGLWVMFWAAWRWL